MFAAFGAVFHHLQFQIWPNHLVLHKIFTKSPNHQISNSNSPNHQISNSKSPNIQFQISKIKSLNLQISNSKSPNHQISNSKSPNLQLSNSKSSNLKFQLRPNYFTLIMKSSFSTHPSLKMACFSSEIECLSFPLSLRFVYRKNYLSFVLFFQYLSNIMALSPPVKSQPLKREALNPAVTRVDKIMPRIYAFWNRSKTEWKFRGIYFLVWKLLQSRNQSILEKITSENSSALSEVEAYVRMGSASTLDYILRGAHNSKGGPKNL